MRHGEVHNPDGVLYGRLDGYHLSELGARMAQQVADHLVDRDITLVVASSLLRAQETASPIAASHGIPVTTDDRVIEAGNTFEGTRVGTMRPIDFVHPRYWKRMSNPLKPSWGEPYAEIAARMLATIAEARSAAAGHEAVIVSHQLPIWTARNALVGARLWHDPRKRECRLASLTTLTYAGGQLESIEYSEPAGALLAESQGGTG
ncbi:histidine phosphatase family protein [Knoellia koreensis]|uniref:Histidine phosphatase family protein n=1 Tax=Knoellia koreensis TaxID=2730921 RepID=A0A849HCH0_9MICO|nr:histidine phosphatase family protein [Knoellia sp. DB2414S]NNM47590.1 histidine phosphatase family protein [Knoellia sp. DB2414S]